MSLLITPSGGYWTFLGTGTASNAVRTSTVTWQGTYQQLMIEYFIKGHSNSSVGRLIVGPTAGPSETATDHACQLIETTTATNTVSIPGWPLTGSIANRSRHGFFFINNQLSFSKRCTGIGQHDAVTPVASTAPTGMSFSGSWINTTSLIQSAKLANYDTLIATTVSTRTFDPGTYISVWGKNND